MHRGESAVRGHAMRGPEPRAPELEIPRPSGAGVGAQFSGLSSSLAFELGVCPECGGRIVEHSGLLVCENCGLVAAPVYAPPKLDPTANLAPSAPAANPARGFFERAVEAVAGELGLPAKAALELYKRLKALAKPEEAAAVAIFVTAKRTGARPPPAAATPREGWDRGRGKETKRDHPRAGPAGLEDPSQ